MSVALVVLRLEIAEKYPLLEHLHYKAPNFNLCEQKGEDTPGPKVTYAEAVSRQGAGDIQDYSKWVGRRNTHEISIQTFPTEEMQVESEVSLQWESTVQHGDSDKSAEKTENSVEDKDTKTCQESRLNGEDIESDDNIQDKTVKDSVNGPTAKEDTGTDSKKSQADAVPGTSKEEASISSSSVKLRGSRRSPVPVLSGVPKEGDYCFRPVESGTSPVTLPEDGECSSRPGSANRPKSHSPTSKLSSTIRFFSGNPLVETTEGIIHLYKDNQMTSLTEDVPRSEMICILAVPATLNTKDILTFVAPVEPWIESLQIIRDGTPNQYMVLLKFRSQKYADEFYKNYNTIPFNSIEPDICHLVYVAKIETIKSVEGGSLPMQGLTELPTCPVCLERMDESVDGILTILCNHSFHGSCLAKWEDTSCPVCRYIQTPEAEADNKCFECSAQESLWICLICGHVGCGRYVDGHAYRHYQETQHCYTMKLGNNCVWDYAGDNYVHRLIQNKGDGKLVEVDEGGNWVEDEKLDSLTLEYTYLLTSQLESQRHYFEEKIQVVEKESLKQIEEVELRSKKTLEECMRLERQMSSLAKEKKNNEKKCSQLNNRLSEITAKLKEEQELNKSLQQNQRHWQDKVGKMEATLQQKDKEIQDVQEQLRDVMFYLEAQQKLSNTTEVSQEEIQEGQILVGASPDAPSAGARKKSRKKGR